MIVTTSTQYLSIFSNIAPPLRRLLFVFLLLLSFASNASHIVGGEITYAYVSKASNGNVTYAVTLKLYMDCYTGNPSSIASDNTANLNVFDKGTGALMKSLSKNVSRTGPINVNGTTYKCIKKSDTACVDMYTYVTNITLPKNTGGYIITFERCCRNSVTVNISNPGSTGATYWTEIKPESSIGVNSSPVFKARPPVYLCLNTPFSFNHSATDADGDSLVYELYTPYYGASTNKNRPDFNNAGAGTPVLPSNSRVISWLSPYSVGNEMGGNPILEIDPETGWLTVTPNFAGQYVVGIKVLEYRKGVLIGETKRDYQFNVSNCQFDVVSAFYTPKVNCVDKKIMITNQSVGAVKYRWDFGDTKRTDDTSNSSVPTYNYAQTGIYKITLIAKSTVCADTFEFTIQIKNNPKVKLANDTLYCKPTSVVLNAGNPGLSYQWNTGQKTQSITVGQTGNYIVTVTDAPCFATDTVKIIMDDFVFNAGKDTTLCDDNFIPFNYVIPNWFKSYLWSNGDKTNAPLITKAGKYWININDIYNCPRTDTIEVFHLVPPKSNLNDTLVCPGYSTVFDAKVPNYTYLWNTGETTKQIQTSQPGKYWVKISNGLCSSSDTALLSNYIVGVKLPNDTFFCGPFQYTFTTNKPFATYAWPDGSTKVNFTATKGGHTTVGVTTKEGCYDTAGINIINYPQLFGAIVGDTAACTASVIDLVANDQMVNYEWSTGDNTQMISVTADGNYFVILKDTNNCKDTAFHKIKKNPDLFPNKIYVPNVFTPNGDNLNELFPDTKFKSINAFYHIEIYNRWGEKLFESDNPEVNWDGRYNGKLCQSDVYIYQMKYLGCDNNRHSDKGMFHLLY
jgi:gliding motility-associated-like protein